MTLTSALISDDGVERISEVMVHNGKSKETTYLTPGDDLDGGTLVYVHQTEGALVHREDEYSVYPLGAKLTGDIDVDEAVDCPRLQEVAGFLRESEASQSEPEGEQELASAEESAGDAKGSPKAPVAEGDADEGGLTGDPSKPAADRPGEPKSDGKAAGAKAKQGDKVPGSADKSTAEKEKRKREPPRRGGARKPRPRNVKQREKKD